ncbi:MAG: DUF5009 domain-containing protein [Bacteroidota bacterium]
MKRYPSLDIFRGMTICLMIIVNTQGDWGSAYEWLLHAPWHGFTPTDLVFPSFMFAVGNSLAFVLGKWKEKSFGQFMAKVSRRAIILFLLGFIMYWFPFVNWAEGGGVEFIPFSDTRIWGVLQRLAVGYFVGAIMVWYLKPKQIWIAGGIMLLAYWLIMYAFGDYSLENNAPRKLDVFLFGASHLYMGEGIPFDPEGLLSTLPAIVNVLGGYLLGNYIKQGEMNYEKLAKILLVGCVLIFAAVCWHQVFPINKKIWTSSYVLLTIGLDICIIAGIIYTLHFITPPWKYGFFETFGKNPLFIYLLSQYIAIFMFFFRVDGNTSVYRYVYQTIFEPIGPKIGSLVFSVTFMLLCWGVGKILDRKNIYIKV